MSTPGPDLPSAAERAGELVVRLLEMALQTAANPPVRARSSPTSLLAGRLDVVVVELRALHLAGIPVERLLVRAESVRIAPGLPPRLQAAAVGMKVRVSQSGLDRWAERMHLPVRVRLTPDGVVVRTGLGGVALGEVTAHLDADGSLLRLRPVGASVLGVRPPGVGTIPALVPLPPLPAGARLTHIDHEDRALTAWLDLGALDEPITPSLYRRLARRFLLPRLG